MTLEEIKQRAEAATPGPWHTGRRLGNFWNHAAIATVDYNANEAAWEADQNTHKNTVVGVNNESGHIEDADALFIAHARTDIPKLLKIIELYESVMHNTDAVWVSAKIKKILEGE